MSESPLPDPNEAYNPEIHANDAAGGSPMKSYESLAEEDVKVERRDSMDD